MNVLKRIESYYQSIDFRKAKKYIKPALLLFLIYLIGASAIFRANFYYIDDMGRARLGYIQWDTMNRHVSAYLAQAIHTDSFLADISPLTQFIALFEMAIAAIIVIHLFQGDRNIGWMQILAAVPFALSPYFLECISYKYDSPYMALSVLAGIAPLLLRNRKTIAYMGASIVGLLVVSMTYQASWGIYPVLVIILATRDWNMQVPLKKVLKFIGISVVSYVIALAFFKFFIASTVSAGYISDEMFAMPDLIAGIFKNLIWYYEGILGDFRKEWLWLIAIIVIAYVWNFVCHSKQNKIVAFFVAIVSLTVMAMLVFGAFPALKNLTRSIRYMYGFCIFVAFLAIAVSVAPRVYVGKAACVALSWCFIILSLVYGNALCAQAEYTDYRISVVAESLSELDCVKSGEKVNVKVSGTIGYATSVPRYQIIRKLVPVPFKEKSYWGVYGLVNYYGLDNLVLFPVNDEFILHDPDRVVDNALYSIDVEGQNVLVTLK